MSKNPLDLLGMKVHGQDAVGAGRDQEVRHELGGDGNARLVLAVLAGVAVEGEDRGDALGRGAAGRVQHDQQFHQVLVRRGTGRLDDVDVAAADVLHVLDEDLAFGEASDLDVAQRHFQNVRNLAGQFRIGATRKQV